MMMKRRLRFSFLVAVMFLFLLSFSASAATTLGKVGGLTASSYKNTIYLKWNKVSKATSYEVCQVNKANSKILSRKTVKTNAITIKNLAAGKTFYFRVRACGTEIKKVPIDPKDLTKGYEDVPQPIYGALSATVTAKTTSSTLAAPNYLKLEAQGNCSVTLNWERISKGKGYVIEYMTPDMKTFQTLRTTSGYANHSLYISGLKGNTTYTFRVRSYKKDGKQLILGNPSKTLKVKVIKFTAELASVRAPYYVVTVKAKTTCTNTKTNKAIALKKGQTLYVKAATGTTVVGFLKDGTPIRILRSKITYKDLDCNPKNDYSANTKETFINIRGYGSSTSHFIWVSQSKLRVNVFKGSKGNWKLQKSFPCCVGSYKSRTIPGLHKILKTVPLDSHGGPALWFSPGTEKGGTHENPMGCAFHKLIDSHKQNAVSNGCVRLAGPDLNWLYQNCGVGTAVYVY